MKKIYKILNYDGPLHALRERTQELQDYYFTCLYLPNTMMQDADALSRYYDPLVTMYISTANAYHQQDEYNCAGVYIESVFIELMQNNRYTLRESKSIASSNVIKRKIIASN
uniref:Uncharacterized protein n=1 Tax=Eucampia antarctica TaxID=49252 RepID=A0A7S2SJ32_9STRA